MKVYLNFGIKKELHIAVKLLSCDPAGAYRHLFSKARASPENYAGIDPEMPLLRHRYKRIMKYDLPMEFVMR